MRWKINNLKIKLYKQKINKKNTNIFNSEMLKNVNIITNKNN